MLSLHDAHHLLALAVKRCRCDNRAVVRSSLLPVGRDVERLGYHVFKALRHRRGVALALKVLSSFVHGSQLRDAALRYENRDHRGTYST